MPRKPSDKTREALPRRLLRSNKETTESVASSSAGPKTPKPKGPNATSGPPEILVNDQPLEDENGEENASGSITSLETSTPKNDDPKDLSGASNSTLKVPTDVKKTHLESPDENASISEQSDLDQESPLPDSPSGVEANEKDEQPKDKLDNLAWMLQDLTLDGLKKQGIPIRKVKPKAKPRPKKENATDTINKLNMSVDYPKVIAKESEEGKEVSFNIEGVHELRDQRGNHLYFIVIINMTGDEYLNDQAPWVCEARGACQFLEPMINNLLATKAAEKTVKNNWWIEYEDFQQYYIVVPLIESRFESSCQWATFKNNGEVEYVCIRTEVPGSDNQYLIKGPALWVCQKVKDPVFFIALVEMYRHKVKLAPPEWHKSIKSMTRILRYCYLNHKYPTVQMINLYFKERRERDADRKAKRKPKQKTVKATGNETRIKARF